MESFLVENNNLIKNFAFFKDRPLNENNPNRNACHLSHAHMKGIANQSIYFLFYFSVSLRSKRRNMFIMFAVG